IDTHVFGPNWQFNNSYGFASKLSREIYKYKNLAMKKLVQNSRKNNYALKISDLEFKDRLNNKYRDNLFPPVTDKRMVELYSESKISLGFLEVFINSEKTIQVESHLHLREFEAPMSRACYIVNYSDELTEFYEPNKEVIVFKDEQELVDKIKYYLSNEDEAEKIRIAGYKRALKCHTYQKRFKDLFIHLDF
ncbi:MAG: glycosyltransferase family protein, partial [Candidatus Helarchaeota archaeon]